MAEGKLLMKKAYKIVASFVGAGLLIAAIVVSFWAFRQIRESADARNHTSVVIKNANDFLSDLVNAETSQRGYLLTNDETFLKPYLAVRDSISSRLKNLRQLTRISTANQHLDALAPLIDSKLAYLSHNIELVRNHNMTAAIAIVRSGQGKQSMDSIRAEIKRFTQIEEDALAQHDAEFQSNMRHMLILILTASLLVLLFAVLFVYLINRETKHQVKNLIYLETQQLLEIQKDTNKQLQQSNLALKVSEEKIAIMLNSIGDAVLATDAEACVTLLNPMAEQLTGWTQAEAIGRPVNEIFHIISEKTRQPSIVPVKATLANGMAQGLINHTVLIARDGGEYAIDDSCAPIHDHDGQVVGTMLVFRDITKRRDIENGLEKNLKELEIIKKSANEASEFAESIINTVREPLLSLDQDLRVVTVSRSFYEFFKVKPEETVGHLIYDLGNKQWDIPKLQRMIL